jgi:RNA polymerase sigma factor (sigma-70 family)
MEITAPAFEDTVEAESPVIPPSFEDTTDVEQEVSAPRFEDTSDIEPPKSGLWDSFKETLSSSAAKLTAGAIDLLTPMTHEDTVKMYAKAGQTPPEMDEETAKAQAESGKLSASMREQASVAREASGLVFEKSSPESKNLAAQIGRGGAMFASLFPAMLAGRAAFPLMALQGAGEAYEGSYKAKEDQLKFQGITDPSVLREEATKEADKAALRTAPALLLYMVGGKVAAGIGSKLAGEAAGPLKQAIWGAATAVPANIVTGAALRAIEAPEGQRLNAALPSIENLTADTLFGVFHGVGEFRNASLESKRKAYQELLDRGFTKDQIHETEGSGQSQAVLTPESETVIDTANPKAAEIDTALTDLASPPTGERIVSTGILSEEGVKTGPEWKSSHADIIKNNPELALDENVDQRKGFIIQDAEGNQRFVGRKEALEVARRSGQVDESLIRSETAEGLISEALIESQPTTENAVPQRQTEEVLRNVPQQPEGIEGPMPTEEGTEGVPRSGARETQPKIQAEEVANTLQPYFNQAVEAAKKAGATDPESAASQAQIELSQSQTPISNPQALFIEAARRQALKQQERESAEKRGGGKVEEMTEEPSIASGGPTPAQEVVRAETVEIVSKAVQSLPENQRKVMQMTMEERSDKDIASELGMTEASVRKARQNAREALKEKLSSKVDWTGATDDSSLIDDIRSDISAIKAPQKLGIVPEGTQEVQGALDKIIAIGKEALSVGKVSDLRRGILHWVAKIQKSFGEVSEAQKAIKKMVRDPIRRAAITDWIEANGDKKVLSERAYASKDPILKKGYEAAQTLTPEELKMARKIKDAFNTMHTRGVENDVLDSFVDNYVNHIWERKPQRLTYSSKSLRDSFRFSRARVFKTFFEGEQAGFRPKTKDISKLLPVYIHEMNNAIAARQLVRDLSSGTASDGRPLVAPMGIMKTIEEGDSKSYLLIPKVPRDADLTDYKTLDQPALSKWTWRGNDENGNPILVKSDLALHPEAYERLRRALGTSAIRKWYNSEGSHLASIPKSIVKAIDVTQSTIKQTMLGFLSTFHVVQEGTHAIGHKINPFHTPKIDLSNPDQYDAAKHGLMLNPDKISEQFFMEGVGQSGIISKIPGIGRVADAFSNWMFHSYIPGLKYKTYEAILKRNTERLKSEATEEEIKVLSAEQTNAAYGHLNYADLGRDPTMQHLLQLGLLAPDFLEARGRFAAQALKAVAGSKAGREQFAAIALLAAAQFIASQIINKLVDGQFHLDHPFEVRVGDRRYTLRSVPEDIFSLIKDTRRFTYGRINPLTGKGSIQLLTGQNYRGEKVDAKETLTELVAQSIPLTIQAIPGVRNLTETGRNQPVSPLEQFAGSMGLRVSRYSPISEVYQLASEWEDKHGVPRDRGSYPVSKYQQLRYALEDQDEQKAFKEYQKLRETMTSQKIDSGFRESMNHPFTQSQRMDEKFSKSLSQEERNKYDLARQKRKDIISRFHRMRKPR